MLSYEKELKRAAKAGWHNAVLEGCDGRTRWHMRNTARYALVLVNAAAGCMPELRTDKAAVIQAAAVHDVGKKAIPPEILLNPGKLTPAQFHVMRQHPVAGACLLTKYFNEGMCPQPGLPKEEIIQGVLYHHERWDGAGYPFGLKKQQIPLSAQFVALADVYDALTSPRPYKQAYSHEQALAMIGEGRCGAFSPYMLDILLFAGPMLERCKIELTAAVSPVAQ